jgi:Protein of unknown function (DUF1566)
MACWRALLSLIMNLSRAVLLTASLLATAVASQADDHAPWVDPDTHMMWVVADNGSGLSLSQAKRFCQESSFAGFHDWVLPSINELQSLYDPAVDRDGRHVKGPLKLTGWEWSSTPGQQAGEGWVLDF